MQKLLSVTWWRARAGQACGPRQPATSSGVADSRYWACLPATLPVIPGPARSRRPRASWCPFTARPGGGLAAAGFLCSTFLLDLIVRYFMCSDFTATHASRASVAGTRHEARQGPWRPLAGRRLVPEARGGRRDSSTLGVTTGDHQHSREGQRSPLSKALSSLLGAGGKVMAPPGGELLGAGPWGLECRVSTRTLGCGAEPPGETGRAGNWLYKGCRETPGPPWRLVGPPWRLGGPPWPCGTGEEGAAQRGLFPTAGGPSAEGGMPGPGMSTTPPTPHAPQRSSLCLAGLEGPGPQPRRRGRC